MYIENERVDEPYSKESRKNRLRFERERERERDRKGIKFEQSLSDLCLLSIGKDVTARKFGLDRLESYT